MKNLVDNFKFLKVSTKVFAKIKIIKKKKEKKSIKIEKRLICK